MPCEADHLAQAGRVSFAVGLLLPGLVLVEPPDAAVLLEQRAGILPRHFRLAIRLLTGVRWRADVHVHAAAAVERHALVFMLPPIRQPLDHRLRPA